jgi:phage virion morphogenesis protein
MSRGMEFVIDVDELAVQSGLGVLLGRLRDRRPMLRAIGERVVTATDARFESETAPNGEKWAPLAESTKKAKLRKGYSDKPLQRTGRMKGSIHPEVHDDYVEVGTNVLSKDGFPYPFAHQLGAAAERLASAHFGQGHAIPKREFLGASDSDKAAFLDIARKYFERLA